MKFRDKSVVIEAEQFQFGKPYPPGVCDGEIDADCPRWPHMHTLEGRLNVLEGDWIIKGTKGEFYPCKPDIFAGIYKPELSESTDVLRELMAESKLDPQVQPEPQVVIEPWIESLISELCTDNDFGLCLPSAKDQVRMIAARAYAPERSRLRRELLALADNLGYEYEQCADTEAYARGKCHAARKIRALVDRELPEPR